MNSAQQDVSGGSTGDEALAARARGARRVLVVSIDGIGDSVLLTPFLRELRQFFPKAFLDFVVETESRRLFETSPYIDRVTALNAIPSKALRPIVQSVNAYRLMRARRSARYDLAILPRWDVDDKLASAYLAFSRAPLRVGYTEHSTPRKRRLNPGFDRLLTHPVRHNGPAGEHEVLRNLRLLRELGAQTTSDALELWPTAEDSRQVAALLNPRDDGRPLIALGIGASSDRRRWPIESYVRLARRLVDAGARILVVGGAADRERQRALVGEVGDAAIAAAGELTVTASYVAIKRCMGFIGNDSGPMHLASTARTPVVLVSCHPRGGRPEHANSPMRFGPWQVRSVVLQPARALGDCGEGCEAGSAHCIRSITVEQVYAAAIRLFGLAD